MAPKRTTRSTPVTPTPNATPTTTVTEAQLQALIDQGVAAAMAKAEASRVRNGYNNNGTEGVVELTRWFEKMESVFSISNCTASCQVKFTTCTLQDDALTWWNSHVKTTTPEAAHAMPWATLKKMMTDKYCPRGKIKKIETEMWNLKVKGTDMVAYMPMLNVRQKGKESNSDRKSYVGSKPLCSKCNYNHEGLCLPRCNNCKRVGHLTRDCRSRLANANNNNNQKGNGCYECGAQGHFRRNCPKLRNNDRDNQAGNDRAPAKVYVVGNAGANPNNVVAGHFKRNCPKLNNNDRGNQAGNNRAPAKVYAVGNAGANPDNVVAEMGSFDAIIGMDWLSKYSAVIDCAKKIVRIPSRGSKDLLKGSHVFLAHGTYIGVKTVRGRCDLRCTTTQMGFIRPSSSPWGAPVLFVKKKDESHSGVRLLSGNNKLKVKKSYPLPRMIELIRSIFQGSSGYSKIDLWSGYHQVGFEKK
ncbi:putative reverse transcriptase domain-containing protein [Tanacetum coccineum]